MSMRDTNCELKGIVDSEKVKEKGSLSQINKDEVGIGL
jgi:hypothetical protein